MEDKTKRPEPFKWATPKVSGEAFNLTADEWNTLLAAIDKAREYKGFERVDFTRAVQGEIFKADMYNQARQALQEIMDHPSSTPEVSAGTSIEAAMLNTLAEELNAVE